MIRATVKIELVDDALPPARVSPSAVSSVTVVLAQDYGHPHDVSQLGALATAAAEQAAAGLGDRGQPRS